MTFSSLEQGSQRRLAVVFVIPLRPQGDDGGQWSLTCNLLQQTIGSLTNQSDPEWMAFIAGHTSPRFLKSIQDNRIMFHEVDWAAPHPRGPHIDKSWKSAFAAMRACPFASDYWMILDADDLLHRGTVATIKEHRKSPAIIFDRGWEFDIHLQKALRRNSLSSICGSTTALSTLHFPLPKGRGWEEWNNFPYIHFGHHQIKEVLKSKNLGYVIPRSRCIAYLTAHKSSLSMRHTSSPWKRLLGFMLFGRPLSPKLSVDYAYSLNL
jgi:hypothetical protein